MNSRIRELAEKLWNYHLMKHQLIKADVVVVLCSHDERVAERGAQLLLENWAPLIVFSGGHGAITKRLWTEPEATRFARIAAAMGVPANQILVETESTNTGENIEFTRQLLNKSGINPNKLILVQKPYMERRSYATFKRLWPDKEFIVTSPQVEFDEYLTQYAHGSLSVDDVISIMVGDLQRIRFYPARGFQIAQEIPADVWLAFEELSLAGYNRHLIQNPT